MAIYFSNPSFTDHAQMACERRRLQSLAEQHLKDAMRPLSLEELAADTGADEPTDIEIVAVTVEAFGWTLAEAIKRLQAINFTQLSKE